MISTGSREFMYKMIPAFDFTPSYAYAIMLLANIWIGTLVATQVIGEVYTIALLIFHLNGRYLLMRKYLLKNVENLLAKFGNQEECIALHFHNILVETLKENIKLNKFAQEVQEEFSFRLFIIISFMAATFCTMCYKVYTVSI